MNFLQENYKISLQLHCMENGWQRSNSGRRKAIQEDFALFQVRSGDALDHNDSMGVGEGGNYRCNNRMW